MKNSKLRRALLLVASAVLLVCVSVGATLAYLTDDTEVVVNTFSVGNVTIDLDEAPVDVYGDVITGDRRTYNDYKLLPGHEYTKDPIVHVQSGSEKCLVYVVVENPLTDILGWTDVEQDVISIQMTWADGTEGAGPWSVVDTVGNKTLYAYETVVDARTQQVNLATFTTINVQTDVDYNALNAHAGEQIKVTAYAIQSDGLIAAATPTFDELKQIWKDNFSNILAIN